MCLYVGLCVVVYVLCVYLCDFVSVCMCLFCVVLHVVCVCEYFC